MTTKVTRQKVNGGFSVYKKVQLININAAAMAMSEALLKRSKVLAPKDSGQMRFSATTKKSGTEYITEYGNSNTEYASVQEAKQFRGYTTSGTGPKFLRASLASVAKQGLQFWYRNR